ncbi:alpha/beta hydrolase fold domain-containing protein [Rhodobacterales bacterium HKCCE3408]|nr:alpha/beta hydrolase fold domain-containing protein [Rhodobacterales bacterium HKCCE3408]
MRFVLALLAILAALAGLAVLGLVIGALLDPTGSLFAVLGSMVWATYGPHLLLIALVAALAGLVARGAGLRRLGGLALVLTMPALAGAAVILARITLAALPAGAAIDPLGTLALGSMDAPPPDMIETVETVAGTDLRAAIYRPAGTPGPAPVIVYIHGGGFRTGTFTETAADLRWFADRGWLVISVEYRLFTPDNPTWDLAQRDAACGLAWARDNAGRFGGDPARIALLGDSAGGNLAINVGFAAAAGRATTDCASPVPVPSAIATLYPAVDPESIYTGGFPIPGFQPTELIEGFLGGPPADHPDRVAAVSSASYLTPDAPPTLIVLPLNDSLVVAHGTEAFVQAAQAAGVDLDLVRIPYANHVFNQMAAQSLGNQIGRSLRLHFLESRLR